MAVTVIPTGQRMTWMIAKMPQKTILMICTAVFDVGCLDGFQCHEALYIHGAAVFPKFHKKLLSFK
jgi:hypothetical protein